MSAAPPAAAISAAIDDLYQAFLAGDRQRFDRHLHPQVTTWETHLPGPLRERSELDSYRDQRDAAGARPRLHRLAAEGKRVDVWGDTGCARYELVAEPVDGASPQRFRVTDVLLRTATGWQIAHHHSELVQEPG